MKPRYSLRTLLILMFLVGPLCLWGWPAYESWRDERARAAKEAWEIKRVQQRIAILDQQYRIAGGVVGPSLTGTETLGQLHAIEFNLDLEVQRAQFAKMTQARTEAEQRRGIFTHTHRMNRYSKFLLHFEGSAEELREHLGEKRAGAADSMILHYD